MITASNQAAHWAASDRIRYAQCWEDADILLDALQVRPGDVCLSIASAGDNSLALLTRDPARVIAIDMSAAQLHCLELRVAAYRCLDHPELLELMGSRPSVNRRRLLQRCRPALSASTWSFWDARWAWGERWGIGGAGRFETYLRLFRQIALPLVHNRARVDDLLQQKSLPERRRFYSETWNGPRWRWMLRMFFSRFLMSHAGRESEFFRHAPDVLGEHLAVRIAHALQELDPADNPYLHWILRGRHGNALPLALRPEHFQTIRANLGRLEWRQQSLAQFAARGEPVDAFNLSDVFEYLDERTFTALYANLLGCARAGARLAYWNMLVPRSAPPGIGCRVKPQLGRASDLHERDKAFFYSRFVVEVAE